MTAVDCGCCPLGLVRCYDDGTIPDLNLALGSNAGGSVIDAGVSGGTPTRYHYTNWGGLGFDGDVRITFTGPVPSLAATQIVIGTGGRYVFEFFFGETLTLKSLLLIDFDGPAFEQAFNVFPLLSSVDPNFTLGACSTVGSPPVQLPGQGCVRSIANNQSGRMYWDFQETNYATFTVGLPAGAGLSFPDITLAPSLPQAVAFSCDGESVWLDSATGDEVDPALLVECHPAPTPVAPVALPITMAGFAFNDAANEFICNVVPAPATNTGFTPTGACFDPTVLSPFMTWAPTDTIEMEYGSAAGLSGGVIVNFGTPGVNAVAATNFTWATNLVNMNPGEQRISNVRSDGKFAVLTYVSGPLGSSPSGTIRMEAGAGGASIGIHRTAVSIVAPIRFRLEFFG